jgi:hypothetical protein
MDVDNDPPEKPVFHRSSYCGAASCVEVAVASPDTFLVRDAKNPDPGAPVLSFDRAEWDAFLAGVQAGEFSPEALLARL